MCVRGRQDRQTVTVDTNMFECMRESPVRVPEYDGVRVALERPSGLYLQHAFPTRSGRVDERVVQVKENCSDAARPHPAAGSHLGTATPAAPPCAPRVRQPGPSRNSRETSRPTASAPATYRETAATVRTGVYLKLSLGGVLIGGLFSCLCSLSLFPVCSFLGSFSCPGDSVRLPAAPRTLL